MKKSVLFFILMATTTLLSYAESFTVDCNGVDISFYTLSSNTVGVSSASYSGMVVIPDTVTHNGNSYAVVELGASCFASNNNITYVSLPATLTNIKNHAFFRCNGLDSIELRCATPPSTTVTALAGFETIPQIRVPCGSMHLYYAATRWSDLSNYISSCSVFISVTSDNPDLGPLKGNGQHEIGDTVTLSFRAKNYILYGWEDGSIDNPRKVVVSGPASYEAQVRHLYSDTVLLNANNISTRVNLFGNLSFDGNRSNYYIRSTDSSGTLYASGLWIGGYDEDNALCVAANRFFVDGCDYVAGPLTADGRATTTGDVAIGFHHVWRISRDMIDYHIAHLGEASYVMAADIASWPANGDAAAGYDRVLAPFYDADSDGTYNPWAGDYPLIKGDMATYTIYNDSPVHTESLGRNIGIEVHAMTYAFDEPTDTALNNTVFINYKIFNRGSKTLSNTYVGLWTDCDLGYAYDDRTGCDVQRSTYYFYNGKDVDGPGTSAFSGIPPAQGCTFLAGPRLADDQQDNPLISELSSDNTANYAINGFGFGDDIVDNERYGMTSFIYYTNSSTANNGEPIDAQSYYNYMRAKWRNGSNVLFGGDGYNTNCSDTPCRFMYPGDSDPLLWGTNGVDLPTWYESAAPGDRRGIAGSGPFTFTPGQVEDIDICYTTAFTDTGSAFTSVVHLGYLVDSVRMAFQRDTTRSGKPFTYAPYSAPRQVSVAEAIPVAVQVYPNPASQTVQVSIQGCSGGVLLELFDVTGRCVERRTVGDGVTPLDVAQLQHGVYLLHITGQNIRKIHKIVLK